jgi:methylamine---glutamate N-methyltransferase subunit C
VTSAPGFPEAAVRRRARLGAGALFPELADYGSVLYGSEQAGPSDWLDGVRIAPPNFTDMRLEKLIELGREPLYSDVELATRIGGLQSTLPVYLSAVGSTRAADTGLIQQVSRQAGKVGIPMVIGENVIGMSGYGRLDGEAGRSVIDRVRAYSSQLSDGLGGVCVQQNTEDADAELWNLVYSDPAALPLLESGRLAFELKVGQGAKPGLGGMTMVDRATAGRLGSQYHIDGLDGADPNRLLRSSTPGTFTAEILRQQIRLMRNNFPRARVWVKLLPGRDIAQAAQVAWTAGADAVTVDGAEGGSGWAPTAFLNTVGLPLGTCLQLIGNDGRCLLASGRIWEGGRAVKALALGARAVGLGRAALLAVHENPESGLEKLLSCLATELRLLISAVGKYRPDALDPSDLWLTDPAGTSLLDQPAMEAHYV